MTDLFIKNSALIKSSEDPDHGYVVHANNVKGLYNGDENSISYIINQLETRINNIQPSSFAPTLNNISWESGSFPSTLSINSGETEQISEIKIFGNYTDNWIKNVTSQVSIELSGNETNNGSASISGTTLSITAPTVETDKTITVTFKYEEFSTQKSYTAKAIEPIYYWYAGPDEYNLTNYTSLTKVNSIPSSGSITANRQYVYFVIPANKQLESLYDNTFAYEYDLIASNNEVNIYRTVSTINGTINYTIN